MDGGTPPSSTTDGGSTSPTSDGGSDGGTTTGSRPTLSGLGEIPITLSQPLDPAKTYRFAVVWFQLNDDGPDPEPEIGYDAPFAASQTSVSIPSLVGPSDANLLCNRDGADEAVYPCRADSPFKIGIAALMIAEDVNGNGKVDVSYSGEGERVLSGHAAVIYSEKGTDVLPLSKSTGTQALVDGPLHAGAWLYESYKPDAGADRLRDRTGPIVFDTSGPNLD